jgi:hypothetical protein
MVAHKFAGQGGGDEFAGFGDSVEQRMAGNLVRTTPGKGSSRLKRGTPAWDDE